MFEINTKGIAYLLIVEFMLICLAGAFIPHVRALEYYQEGLHNDPLELRVSQGDTILLGKTYDLTGVSGLSYQFAYWKDWKIENTNCKPDKIIDIRPFKSGMNKSAIYLDPSIWSPGDWFFWDSYECNISQWSSEGRFTVARNKPLASDNKLAFFIIRPNPAPISRANIPMFSSLAGYESAYPKNLTKLL
jgi:hypothetical protein